MAVADRSPDFRLATGSCTYINEPELDRPGKPYGGDYQIFDAMVAQKPDLMVWLGDNAYLREADWSTRTGIYHRYSHTRSAPELALRVALNPAVPLQLLQQRLGQSPNQQGFIRRIEFHLRPSSSAANWMLRSLLRPEKRTYLRS